MGYLYWNVSSVVGRLLFDINTHANEATNDRYMLQGIEIQVKHSQRCQITTRYYERAPGDGALCLDTVGFSSDFR